MNSIIQNLIGMDTLTDQVIATDFLITAKSGVRNCAIALTETATPEVRTFLHNQLRESIELHEELTNYMMKKGWYYPYNANEQNQLDLNRAETSLNIAD